MRDNTAVNDNAKVTADEAPVEKTEELSPMNENTKARADNLAANQSKGLNTKEELNATELEEISGGATDPTKHYPLPKFH